MKMNKLDLIKEIECFTSLCIGACDGLEKYLVDKKSIPCYSIFNNYRDFHLEIKIPTENYSIVRELIDILFLEEIEIYAEVTKTSMLHNDIVEFEKKSGGIIVEPYDIKIHKLENYYTCHLFGIKSINKNLKPITSTKRINLINVEM